MIRNYVVLDGGNFRNVGEIEKYYYCLGIKIEFLKINDILMIMEIYL